MARGRGSKGLVRAGEIPPVVPSAAERVAGGRASVADLRRPRLLAAAGELKTALIEKARELGFDCAGVTRPDALGEAAKHFREFLEAGGHGDMDWLARQPQRRTEPRSL